MINQTSKNLKYKMRYSFMFVITVIFAFFMWFQNDFVTRQKIEIETLHSYFHKIESNMNVKIKESNVTVKPDYKDLKPMNSTDILNASNTTTTTNNVDNTMKTILIWTLPNHGPFIFLLRKNETFVKKKCKVKNCYVIANNTYLDITEFDVVLFNGPEILNKKNYELPSNRSPRQNYVFASVESSDYYPICDNRFDGYFNISWTYKFNSDIFYGYMIIRNSKGEIIGPKKDMHWLSIDEMKPINETVKQKLRSKKKLAAWLVSNCNAPSGRDQFVRKVQRVLRKLKTDMRVDVYGYCGRIACHRHEMARCLQMLEKDYYFYFSFENSFAEDYVTEKLLHPLQHYSVPVVYGIANYTRFMPDGIYLNALELGPAKLAARMLELVANKEQYYSYFKWTNHYSYHEVEEVPETDFHCNFCEAMNDDNLMSRTTMIQNFKEWWNPPKVKNGFCSAKKRVNM